MNGFKVKIRIIIPMTNYPYLFTLMGEKEDKEAIL
jgi:hypothetical protein